MNEWLKHSIGLLLQLLILYFQGSSSNSGTSFLITFPQAKLNTKSTEQVYILMDLTRGYLHDIQISMIFQDPHMEVVANLTQEAPSTILSAPMDRKFPRGTIKGKKYLIRIVTSDLVSVAVLNGGGSNKDTYLAIPVDLLGMSYFTLAVLGDVDNAATFVVLATASNAANVKMKLPVEFLDYTDIPEVSYENVVYLNGDVIELHLEPYEAIQFHFKNKDITGAYVESDQAIAVWSGVNRTRIDGNSASHAIEQLPPTNMTGQQFVMIRQLTENLTRTVRVINIEQNTEVNVYSKGEIPNKFFLSRPGSVLELDFGLEEEMSYIESSRSIIVYWYTISCSNCAGDVSTVWVPPVDATMPYSYTSITSDKHYDSEIISIVVDKDALGGLTLNGEPLESTSEFNFTKYGVVSKTNLIMARLTSVGVTNETFELRQEDRIGFLMILEATFRHRGLGLPMSYGLKFPHKDEANINESDQCCVTVDDHGLALHNNECSMNLDPYMADCCLVNYTRHPCKVKSSSSSCSVSPSTSKRSSLSHIVQANSMLDCHVSCIQADECLGVNFDQAGPADTSCELLLGQPLGYDPNPSGQWRHVICSVDVEYVLEH